MKYDDKILKIIKNYGVSNQVKKLQEEVFELTESVIKYECGCDTLEHVTEELSDVLVLLTQIKSYYDLNDYKITNIMDRKIERQIKRIENENRN